MKITWKELLRFFCIAVLASFVNYFFENYRSFDLVGVITIACIILYRKKSLYVIFIYSLIEGLKIGFAPEWFPNIYIWILLYIITTLLVPIYKRDLKHFFLYIGINACHGLLFGMLYAMLYGPMTGMHLEEIMLTMRDDRFYYLTSALLNGLVGTLIIPIAIVIRKIDKKLGI